MYLRDICGREEGAPPPVDLAAEKRNGDVVRGMIHAGTATAVHDLSDGGLLIALAEMAIAGAHRRHARSPRRIRSCRTPGGSARIRPATSSPWRRTICSACMTKLKTVGVPCTQIGITGGTTLSIAGERAVEVKALETAHEAWLPAYMNAKA